MEFTYQVFGDWSIVKVNFLSFLAILPLAGGEMHVFKTVILL